MSNKQAKSGTPQGFATYITLRNGRRIYAADYGIKAFPLGGGRKKR